MSIRNKALLHGAKWGVITTGLTYIAGMLGASLAKVRPTFIRHPAFLGGVFFASAYLSGRAERRRLINAANVNAAIRNASTSTPTMKL